MKNKVLGFLKKYRLCFLLSLIMVIGLSLTTRYADLYVSGSGMIQLDLGEMYLIFGLPLVSLIYGCASYIKAKKIWIPQLILFVITFLYWFRYGIAALSWEGTYIWSVYPVVFSLIGSLITSVIYFIIKLTKDLQQ